MLRVISLCLASCCVCAGPGQVSVNLPPGEIASLSFAKAEILKAGRELPEALTVQADLTPGTEEAFRIEVAGSVVTVTGGDERGLMYGLLDIAEQLELNRSVKPCAEKPFLPYRILKFNVPFKGNAYLSDEDAANSAWFYDLEYWDAFFTIMAKARYNVVSFWHSHPFGNMVRLRKYPEAAVLRGAEMDAAIKFWHNLYKSAHDHGVRVMWMTWNIHTTPQFAKAHGIADAGVDSPLVRDYQKECLRELLREYPEIDMFGTCPGEAMPMNASGRESFIRECILDPIQAAGKPMPFVHRYWGAEPEALATMVREAKYPGPMLLDIKFNGEHMYSSTKPHVLDGRWQEMKNPPYKLLWHLRNDCLFQFNWGDPLFASQLIKNCAGTAGFVMGSEIEVPGVDRFHTKETEGHKNWRWIWQKHWFRWMLWGRMGYNPDMGEERWRSRFILKYGSSVGRAVYEATKYSSGIIPLLARYHWNYMNGDWYAEGNCGGWNTSYEVPRANFRRQGLWHDIEAYVFNNCIDSWAISIPEWAARTACEKPIPPEQMTPDAVADQLDELARLAEEPLATAKMAKGPPELECELMDIECVALLGRFYADHLRGAANLGLFLAGVESDSHSAYSHARAARHHWSDLATLADKHYVKHEVWLMGQFSWGSFLPAAEYDARLAGRAAAFPRLQRVWKIGDQEVTTTTWSHVGNPQKDGWIDFMNEIAGYVQTGGKLAETALDLSDGRSLVVTLTGDGVVDAVTPDGQTLKPKQSVVVRKAGTVRLRLDPANRRKGFNIQVRPEPLWKDQVVISALGGKLTAPFRLVEDKDSPHGKVVEIPKGAGHGKEGASGPIKDNGWADYEFEPALATSYDVWARVWFKDDDSNSFFVGVDGGEPMLLRDGTFGKWHWVKAEGAAALMWGGSHRLRVRNREDGCRIDEIRLLPAGLDPATVFPQPLAEKLKVWGAAEEAAVGAYFAKMAAIKHPLGTESKSRWEKRRAELRKTVLRDLGLDPLPAGVPLDPRVVATAHRDGYAISRLYFQLFPGCYGSGWLYVPDGLSGKAPVMLNPHGHFDHGAYHPVVQAKLIAMAKKSFICLVTDSIHAADFETGMCPVGLMTWQNMRALDYLCSRPDVDTKRILVTGASGGGQQTMFVMAVDDRPAVAVPVVMACYYNRILSPQGSHCWCNHAPGIAGDTDPIEYLSVFAPKPVFFESSTQDWTANFPSEEWKDVQKVWSLYGAEGKVAQRIDDIEHGYDQFRRERMYEFVAKALPFTDPDVGKEPALAVETEQFLVGLDKPMEGLHDWGKAAKWYRAMTKPSAKLAAVLRSVSPDKSAGALEKGQIDVAGHRAERLLIATEGVMRIPAIFMRAGSGPAVIVLLPDGKQSAFDDKEKPIPLVASLLSKGCNVLLPDVRFVGETQRDWTWNCTIWGRPEAGMAVDDARWAAAYLRTRKDVTSVGLVGVGRMGLVALLAGNLDRFGCVAFDAKSGAYATSPLWDGKGYYSGSADLRKMPLPLIPNILRVGDVPHFAKSCRAPVAAWNAGEQSFDVEKKLPGEDANALSTWVADQCRAKGR